MPPTANGLARANRPGSLNRRPKIVLRPKSIEARSSRFLRATILRRTLFAFVVLGMIWRVARFAGGPPLWGDEAFLAVNLLTRNFVGLLQPLDYFQIAPAGFLGAERLVVDLLGRSEWSLRLIPFLSGLFALGLFARFASKVADRRSALFAVAIFAASYYPVRHATEVKPYATDLLAAMITLGLAWSLRLDRDSIARWVGFTLWVAVGLWCSYPLVFVVAGMGSVLAIEIVRQPSRRSLFGLQMFLLVSASSFLLSYWMVAGPQSKAAPFYSELKTWQGAFPPLDRPWLIPYWLLDVHTGNMLAYPDGGPHFGSLATALLVLSGARALRRSRPALLALLLSPLVPMLLASCLQRYPYGTSARTTLFMAPSFCLLAGIGLTRLIRRFRGARRVRLYRLSILSLGGMILVAIVGNLAWPYKNYEDLLNRRAIEHLAELARPGDVWLFDDGVETLPVSKGLMLEHWLQQMAEVRYNVLARAPVPVFMTHGPESAQAAPSGRTWLIVHQSGSPAFDQARLTRFRQSLDDRLGPPRVRVERMTRGESIESYEYPAPASPSTGR